MKAPKDLKLSQYQPKPMLVVKHSQVKAPRFPVIDAHNHLMQPFGGGWEKRPLTELIEILNAAHVSMYFDMDGGWGEGILQQHLDLFKAKYPERFCVFGGVDWEAWQEQGDKFPEWAAERLKVQAGWGADGLKIWKKFGLSIKDQHGQLARVNDRRLEPIWQTAAELNLPVLIHVADPAAFFLPLTAENERLEELHTHPDWHFPSPPYPAFRSILDDLADLVASHPQTIFIGAHVGCCAEDLAWVSGVLERCPNFHVDIAGRLGELGRQPYSAREFCLKYSGRILFGTDLGPELPSYLLHYRFLETDDEYFDYSTAEIPPQGRWRVYGLHLPEDVLKNIYHANAERIVLHRTE
jgi:predicted TIM-barrel fold metal-dependent hydrolase